jgi:hypothetical protein
VADPLSSHSPVGLQKPHVGMAFVSAGSTQTTAPKDLALFLKLGRRLLKPIASARRGSIAPAEVCSSYLLVTLAVPDGAQPTSHRGKLGVRILVLLAPADDDGADGKARQSSAG